MTATREQWSLDGNATLRCGHTCRMPLYLRIDVIETATGSLLSECEGVEPELFFRARPGSEAQLAELVGRRLN